MPRASRQHSVLDPPLTVDEYFRLIEAGEIDEDAPVELWEGRVVEKVSKGPSHQASLTKLMRLLFRLVPEGWFPTQESPLAIGVNKVPEPDAMVVRGRVDDFSRRPPSGKDVALVVEVSASSLERDLGPKQTAYAAEGIPVYWVVNLVDRRIDVHSNPTPRGKVAKYDTVQIFQENDAVPIVLDGVEVGRIVVSDVLA